MLTGTIRFFLKPEIKLQVWRDGMFFWICSPPPGSCRVLVWPGSAGLESLQLSVALCWSDKNGSWISSEPPFVWLKSKRPYKFQTENTRSDILIKRRNLEIFCWELPRLSAHTRACQKNAVSLGRRCVSSVMPVGARRPWGKWNSLSERLSEVMPEKKRSWNGIQLHSLRRSVHSRRGKVSLPVCQISQTLSRCSSWDLYPTALEEAPLQKDCFADKSAEMQRLRHLLRSFKETDYRNSELNICTTEHLLKEI